MSEWSSLGHDPSYEKKINSILCAMFAILVEIGLKSGSGEEVESERRMI